MDDTQHPASASLETPAPRTSGAPGEIESALVALAAADAADAPDLAERLAADLSDVLEAGQTGGAGQDAEARP